MRQPLSSTQVVAAVTTFCAAIVFGFWLGGVALRSQPSKTSTPILVVSEQDQAEGALINFLNDLYQKDYIHAAPLFGGDDTQLREWNPSIDPQDKVSLWRAGCEHNGFNCLEIRNISFDGQRDAMAYVFHVWFTGSDKRVDFKDANGATMFFFTVKKVNGTYLVMTPPVYTQ